MKIDKHGLKMKGLKRCCRFRSFGVGVVRVVYFPDDGEVLADWFISDNEWCRYAGYYVDVGCFGTSCTMQEVADKVYYKMMEVQSYGV